jgi:SPP1 gp7 family putative phage head morphogenesis protein
VLTKDDLSDRELRHKAKERFAVASRLEAEYLRSLRQLTRQIDHIVKGMAPGGVVRNSIELQKVLRDYAKTVEPWARSVAEKMVTRIARKDEFAWIEMGNQIGRNLRKEIQEAPTGFVLQEFLNEQVRLITSLPTEAADRVHKLTLENLITGARADQIKRDILQTGEVAESRAQLIARTEIARTASGLTMARATHVGSTHYVWRSSMDGTVRESHRKMNGAVVPWKYAPEVDPGKHYHAGMFPNCRCWCEPILTND